jgi:hypothetical protein
MRYKLLIAVVVVGFLFGIGIDLSQASILAGGGGHSFSLYFDENGHGLYSQNGGALVNDPGHMMLDPTGGVAGNVLYYVLPEFTGTGDVRIWEDPYTIELVGTELTAIGTISDVLRFTDVNINGVLTPVMIYYSDVGDPDLADTGLPQNLQPNDVWLQGGNLRFGIVENGIEGGYRDFVWAPDGAGLGNQYFGISDVPEAASIIIWFGLSSLFVMRVWRQRRIAVPATQSRREPWSDESRMAIHQIIERGFRH